ncbi:ADP-ribosyltransferase [Bacillus cereus]|uniref:ADP-ribosyltransferase n=1 Tax=Bacillus TaxID=1386 RepID=UPI0024B8B10B|nr:ADP-ribosyltransferase [Bacillus cereus]WHS75910.1 ADP-ribosyltransferase [Bacillus cereus]
MALTEKDIQEQVKKGSEEKKAFENKFESPEAAKKAKLNAPELINKLKKGQEGADWDKTFDTLKVDTFLKEAPSLKEDLHITVRMTDSYKKEDINKNKTTDNSKVTTIRNEFYTTENLSSDLENLGADEDLIQIQIPAGERIGYFTGNTEEDTRVVLRKNAEYQIDEEAGKTLTVIKGKMRVVWKAKLIKSKAEDKPEDKPENKPKDTPFNAKEYGEKWVEGLSEDESSAIKDYTADEYYRAINEYLRTGVVPADTGKSLSDVKKKIRFMDKAIQQATLTQDIKVYRRSTEPEFKMNGDFLKHTFDFDLDPTVPLDKYFEQAMDLVHQNINKINTDKAYRSTTLNSKVPNDPTFAERPICVEITIPAKTHAPYLGSLSKYPGEEEILLPRGSKFKITGASTVQETGEVYNKDSWELETRTLNTLMIRVTLVPEL